MKEVEKKLGHMTNLQEVVLKFVWESSVNIGKAEEICFQGQVSVFMFNHAKNQACSSQRNNINGYQQEGE